MPLPLGLMRIEQPYRIHGRRTTIVLEETYWAALEQAAAELGRPLRDLVTEVASTVRGLSVGEPYSRALRVWVVDFFRQKLERAERHHSNAANAFPSAS